jgi:peptidoglycan/xylan/chitin deacetylase (PgdA/CDA1 family)
VGATRTTGGIRYWLKRRTPAYIGRRVAKLLSRYGFTPRKAKERTWRLVDLLQRHGAAPTLATPGALVVKHNTFMRELFEAGVELAIHGFDHVDFRSLTPEGSLDQVERAADAFASAGISFKGFRCPYLSYSHEMNGYVPDGLFKYSSNEAVWWDVAATSGAGEGSSVIFDHLVDFYAATPAEETLVLPRLVDDLIEIPVSLPDDLQLLDGLKQGEDGVGEAWVDLLRRSHEQGSIFTVLMHPEAFDLCAGAYKRLLVEAGSLNPPVWIARLGDIADWWQELGGFSFQIDGSTVRLDCSSRAVVLGRGLADDWGRPWPGRYRLLEVREISLVDGALPVVGVAPDVPVEKISMLRQLGYLTTQDRDAEHCAVRIDAESVRRASDDRALVALVEEQAGPLVRFWHWPEGAGSALCITGDLDALSLLDYASRLVTL